MDVKVTGFIILVHFLAFLLMPYQIMLATALRVNVSYALVRREFRRFDIIRIIAVSVGLVTSILTVVIGSPLFSSIAVGMSLFIIYIVDFFSVEKIVKQLM